MDSEPQAPPLDVQEALKNSILIERKADSPPPLPVKRKQGRPWKINGPSAIAFLHALETLAENGRMAATGAVCDSVGLPETTLNSWLNLSEKPDCPATVLAFVARFRRARGLMELNASRRAVPEDAEPRDVQTFMARVNPDRYSERRIALRVEQHHHHDHNVSGSVKVELPPSVAMMIEAVGERLKALAPPPDVAALPAHDVTPKPLTLDLPPVTMGGTPVLANGK